MASVNKVILVGNLGRDPETRTFPSGDQVCNATLATTDKWKDKQSGEQQERTRRRREATPPPEEETRAGKCQRAEGKPVHRIAP